MKAAISAVVWDVFWKNRVVFPLLGALLGIAVVLGFAITGAAENSQWAENARAVVLCCFLISMLLSFVPFTLVESSGGWRMNSTITRWFALPVKTASLVFVPLLAAALFMAFLMWLWKLTLELSLPGLDSIHFYAVLMIGQIAMAALAWTVPRRPVQYWLVVGLMFPVLLLLAFVPQDYNDQFRRGLMIPLSYVAAGLLAYAGMAAKMTRCGAWPGELRGITWRWPVSRESSRKPHWSAGTAFFRMEEVPLLKIVLLSWAALVIALYLYISFVIRESRPHLAFSWRTLAMAGMGILPVLGVAWMAGWGLFLGGEPSAPFRTRLSSHKATLPVTSGFFAGQKVLVLFTGWALVWLPLAALSFFYTPEILGIETENITVVQQQLVRFMTVGAFVATGALPILLLGRIEGFPNVLLTSLVVWVGLWGLKELLYFEEAGPTGRLWIVMGALIAAKLLAAGWGFIWGYRRGHTTWRYPATVVLAWTSILAFMMFVLPGWTSGTSAVLSTVLFLPLARLAWCPLAIATNRHQ